MTLNLWCFFALHLCLEKSTIGGHFLSGARDETPRGFDPVGWRFWPLKSAGFPELSLVSACQSGLCGSFVPAGPAGPLSSASCPCPQRCSCSQHSPLLPSRGSTLCALFASGSPGLRLACSAVFLCSESLSSCAPAFPHLSCHSGTLCLGLA